MKKILSSLLVATLSLPLAAFDERQAYYQPSSAWKPSYSDAPWRSPILNDPLTRTPFSLPVVPQLSLDVWSSRLPVFEVKEIGDRLWRYTENNFTWDNEKRLASYQAVIETPAPSRLAVAIENMKYESGVLTPTRMQTTFKDESGNSWTRLRTQQKSEESGSYKNYQNTLQRRSAESRMKGESNEVSHVYPPPSKELVRSFQETWRDAKGSETNISVSNIGTDAGRWISSYEGTLQSQGESISYNVKAPREADGSLGSLSVRLEAKGAPTVELTWTPKQSQNSAAVFTQIQDSLPIPLLVGPRAAVRMNGVDIPDVPVQITPEGKLAKPILGEAEKLLSLQLKENDGITMSVTPAKEESGRFSLGNAIRDAGYFLTGRLSEAKERRSSLQQLQKQDPSAYLASVGFSDPSFLSFAQLKSQTQNLTSTIAPTPSAESNNGFLKESINAVKALIKAPFIMVGEVIKTVLELPVIKQVWIAARKFLSLPTSVITGDFDKSFPVEFDPNGPALITSNGVLTPENLARALNDIGKNSFGIQAATIIKNNTHWFGIGDFFQSLAYEYLGIIDKPARDMAKAIRIGIQEKGEVFVLAHSQGSAVFKQSLSLLTKEEKSKIHYIGIGPQWIIDAKAEGLASATNIWNKGDPVPTLGNRLKLVTNLLFPWNWGRLSTTNLTRQDMGIRGLAAHGFKQYEEAVKKWADKWRAQWALGASQ